MVHWQRSLGLHSQYRGCQAEVHLQVPWGGHAVPSVSSWPLSSVLCGLVWQPGRRGSCETSRVLTVTLSSQKNSLPCFVSSAGGLRWPEHGAPLCCCQSRQPSLWDTGLLVCESPWVCTVAQIWGLTCCQNTSVKGHDLGMVNSKKITHRGTAGGPFSVLLYCTFVVFR